MNVRSWKAAAVGLGILCVLLALLCGLVWSPAHPKSLLILSSHDPEFGDLMTDDIMVGSVYLCAGDVESLPDRWVVCAGQELLKSNYPMLYAAVGDTYATASVSQDFFALPDLRGTYTVDFTGELPWYLRILPALWRCSTLVLGRPSLLREIEKERANGGKLEIKTTPMVWVVKAL